jgi:hypothetical protein
MSFLPINEQNQMAPQGQTGTNAPTSQGNLPSQTGGSTGAGQGGGAAKGTATGTPTQLDSSASKLGDYLSANAPQIQNQANTVAGGLNQQFGQVGTDITNAANQFNQSVAGSYAAPNQDLVNQAISNPTQFVTNPSNVAGFQGQFNDVYTGPQNFESTTPYSNIQNEVSSAVQNAGSLNTQAGLQNYFAKGAGPNATQASNTLDALLLQGNPQAQQTIQQAANQFQTLTPTFNNAVTQADLLVPAAQQAAQQAAQYAQGQFTPLVQNFNTGLTRGLIQAQQAEQAYNQNLNQDIAAIQPIQQQANIFSGATGVGFEDVNNPYANLSQITQPVTMAQYATPQQYAEAAALQQLGGQNVQVPLNQYNIGEAGTAPNIPTLSNLGGTGLAQEYVNSILNQGPAAGVGGNGQPGLLSGMVFNPQNLEQMQLNPTPQQTALYNLASYLQRVDPNAVTTIPQSNPFFGGNLELVNNPVGV